jgi:hypothetical protein
MWHLQDFYGCYYQAYLPERSFVFNGNVTTMKGHSVISTDLDTSEQATLGYWICPSRQIPISVYFGCIRKLALEAEFYASFHLGENSLSLLLRNCNDRNNQWEKVN